MRAFLCMVLVAASCGASTTGPAAAQGNDTATAAHGPKERLNSLSPAEAARAARSRARALAAGSTTSEPPKRRTHEIAKAPEGAVTHETKIARTAKPTVVERRRTALNGASYARKHERRRLAERAPRQPRVGDVVPGNVRLRDVPTRYALQPPPYPDPYEPRRPLPFRFFFPHSAYEVDNDE